MTAEKCVLIQAILPDWDREFAADSLEELGQLALTSGAQVVGTVTQELRRPSAATLVGSGKLEFLADAVTGLEADLVIFDNELSPVQNRNIEKALEVKVLDRSGLILDIFAMRAQTKEGKLQVELAQLQYLLPRLIGRGLLLSRQAGGIGARGPGEMQLELDRRRIKERIERIKKRLQKVRKTRTLHRAGRKESGLLIAALVGYTNAGKSTLQNALAQTDTYVEDRLFATLNPTHRRVELPSGKEILLVDTVGFIQNLPHQLIESFHATLEEVVHADLLIHVIDAASGTAHRQDKAVAEVLEEIGAAGKPMLVVLNKMDLLSPGSNNLSGFRGAEPVRISALDGTGVEQLLLKLEEALYPDLVTNVYRIPAADGKTLADLYRRGKVIERRDKDGDIELKVEISINQARRFSSFRMDVL